MTTKTKNTEKDFRRHKRIYRFLFVTLGGALRRMFAYECTPAPEMVSNYLVLSNHNTDLDPALVALSFKEQMYFVASEHVLRNNFTARLLKWAFAPIARMKGQLASSTVMDIIRTLKSGKNVCIFAEGNRSFVGKTTPIPKATGKLAKICGAALVTYNVQGGYFTSPRWSKTIRRGKMRGRVVNVYTPEQLKTMSIEEVNAHINEDLYEDAYKRQQKDRVAFRGKRLAEKLECLLFICPECGRIGTMRSHDNVLECDCGMKAVYTAEGSITGTRFSDIPTWDAWQWKEFLSRADKDPTLGFVDESNDKEERIELWSVRDSERPKKVCEGRLTMDRRGLNMAGRFFELGQINGMSAAGSRRLIFSTDTDNWEIHGKFGFGARKYLYWFNVLKGTPELNF